MVTPVDKAALTGHEPSKKRKLSDTIEVPPPKPNLGSRYGTLILKTRSNAHCIRAELLLRHSTCTKFRARITSAKNEGHETDTVPNIRVSGPDEDWCFILSLLGGKKRIPIGPSFHISVVLPMLYIGHTYGFSSLKSAALQRLESIMGGEQLQDGNLAHTLDAVRGYECRLLDVVQQVELEHLCVSAMYICSIVAMQDGYEIDLPHGHHLRSYESANLLASARRDLVRACRQYIFSWWFKTDAPSPTCPIPKKCQSVVVKAIQSGGEFLAVHALGPRPIGYIPRDLCTVCKDAEAESYRTGRMNLLQELPSYFRLHEWPEIENNDV